MAEFPNSVTAMDTAPRAASDFVALDIANLAAAAAADKDSNSSPRATKNFVRKGSLRLGAESKKAAAMARENDAAAFATIGGAHGGEKHAVAVYVAGGEEAGAAAAQVGTPTSGGSKYRRLGSSRRPSPAPWLDPRRVLFAFATLSSMGTLILLYFTLSMNKMSGGDADAR